MESVARGFHPIKHHIRKHISQQEIPTKQTPYTKKSNLEKLKLMGCLRIDPFFDITKSGEKPSLCSERAQNSVVLGNVVCIVSLDVFFRGNREESESRNPIP